MVAIGLLDIPPEIHLQIAESVERRQALKALSVTSRALRSIAQSILFKKLEINLGTELRGSVDDLLANPRICATIRYLELRGLISPGRNDEVKLSLIQKMLPEMVGLRKVAIYDVRLSKTFLDAFLGIAANMPLRINLFGNIYPYGVISTPHTRLQISRIQFGVDHSSLEFCRSMFHASATTLTTLTIMVDQDECMQLADINLPFLHDLTLVIPRRIKVSKRGAVAFLAAQKSIRKLDLNNTIPPIPPNALPNLRELIAPPEHVHQLVPGRPVEAIDVTPSPHDYDQDSPHDYDQDWFREEVGQSTARVRMLRVRLDAVISDTRMVKRMVPILPFLENLWLPVFNDVS